ncbi:uncharacterized protein LOC106653787 [Trichogramma pretiosum]|uniref:uncharacterized protein LOC106653787 n=1 Tax=Trichogramma pretiosum TaxID=7493 RepID=UPI0006C9E3E9|nr:uncharacterized protein LOC106653787 [Trichogramma pretiosum]
MSQDQCTDVISQGPTPDEDASIGAKRSYMEENFQTNPFYEATSTAKAELASSPTSSLSRAVAAATESMSQESINPESFASSYYAHTGAVPKGSGGVGGISSGAHVKMKKFKSATEELSEAKETYSALLRMAAEPNRQNFNAFCEEKRDQLREVREESTKLLELRAIARQLHNDLPTDDDKNPDLIEAKMQSVFQKLERLNLGLEQLQIAHDMKFQD